MMCRSRLLAVGAWAWAALALGAYLAQFQSLVAQISQMLGLR